MENSDPLIGRRLGDYWVQNILGQGGMARVYRGYDSKLDRYAAIKVIEPHLIANADKDNYRGRFLQEARAIARLSHNHIVRVYQFGKDIDNDHIYYMAMSFVEGRDLREILDEVHGKSELMSHKCVLSVISDVANALDYAHKQGVIHRDVKPSNIMINPEDRAILTDFGLALNIEEGTLGNTFGSVHYMAPEQAISSAQAVFQSDLYSLGVMTFEMLTGRVPFDDASIMNIALSHISASPPLPSSINPAIRGELEDILLQALNKDPEGRFKSGAAMVEAFRAALQDDADTIRLEAPLKVASVSLGWPLLGRASSQTVQGSLFASQKVNLQNKDFNLSLLWLGVGVILSIIVGLILVDGVGGGQDSLPIFSQIVARSSIEYAGWSETTIAPIEIVPTDMAMGYIDEAKSIAIDAKTDDEPQVLLRYNGRSLVVYNRAPFNNVNLSGLQFTQGTKIFFSSQWDTEDLVALRHGDCLQVFTIQYQMMPMTKFPAEICRFRQAFFSSVNNFWISDDKHSIFEIKRGDDVLATCPTVRSESDEEHRCLLDLRLIE